MKKLLLIQKKNYHKYPFFNINRHKLPTLKFMILFEKSGHVRRDTPLSGKYQTVII